MTSRNLLRVLLALTLAAAPALAQARPESIRGRVTSDSGAPIAGALVSATMAPDRSYRQATTDSLGRYTIPFDQGTGDYLIHVAAPGFRALRRRLQRTPSDTALVLDLRLTPDVARLAAVSVKAKVLRPVRGDREGNDAGAAEREREGVFAALSPDQEGNFAALANAIPGASAQPNGLSVLGLDGSQSNVTLNGMAFAGAGLPRDARTTARIATSTYDPSRGGFSGGQTAVELARGSRAASRRAHLTLDAPVLQAPDQLASRLGQRYAAFNGSIGGSGEAVKDTWFYNAAAQTSRRTAAAASLLDAGDDLFSTVGVAPDSITRLMGLLARDGVPETGGLPRAAMVSTTASLATRLDYKPFLKGSTEPSPRTWSLTAVADVRDDRALSLAPTATPSRTGTRSQYAATLQGAMSRYLGNTLNESRVALNASRDRGQPSVAYPGGTVLVSSALLDGTSGLTGLAFGGSPFFDYDRRDWTIEAVNETQWYRRGLPHRIKLTAEARLDGFHHERVADRLGTFSFPSLAALADNRPSSFTRTLDAPAHAGGEWSGYLALGDYWRVSPTLLVLYGARLDAHQLTGTPGGVQDVAARFGADAGRLPSEIDASPRLGFTWFYGGGEKGTGIRVSQVAFQPLPPKGVLRGGVGMFRNFIAPSILSDAIGANGLPGEATRLLCLGDAAPAPRFDAYADDPAAIPMQCAGGTGSAFGDAAPTARLFDRDFRAPRSWRGNLSWSTTVGAVGLALEGIYSLNLNQPGTVDLNFAGTPRFALTDEQSRPVFVNPATIVPASGAVSPVDARSSPTLGRVVSLRSDLRSQSRQLTAIVTPASFGSIYYSLAYTLGRMTFDVRGFDGSTFGAPTERQLAPGDLDVRHQLQLQVGRDLPLGMSLALFGRVASGLPYTPRIAGDVNGDGLANDRAFVFDPDRATDAALASGVRALLAGAPAGARDCLARQLGAPAGHNSCRGPWTATLNARLGLVRRYGPTRRSFTAALNLANPLGGLDQLLHGAGNLHGWGTPALPDPTLLAVRGFDAGAQRFRYEVNPRFGSPISSRLSRAPFRISIDFTFDLGVPLQKQQAVRLLSPGRGGAGGPRMVADSIALRLSRQVPDLYKAILDEGDSLLINREQFEALQQARIGYRARVDSVWVTTSRVLANMGDSYDADAAMHLIDDATERAWILGRDELPTLRRILSPLQLRLAPWVPAIAQTEGKSKVGLRILSF